MGLVSVGLSYIVVTDSSSSAVRNNHQSAAWKNGVKNLSTSGAVNRTARVAGPHNNSDSVYKRQLRGDAEFSTNSSSSDSAGKQQQWEGDTEFPISIPAYHVRKDSSGKEVYRGHIQSKLKEFVNGDIDESLHEIKTRLPYRRAPYQEFRRALQCATAEPDFDYTSGVVSLMRLSPPTKESLHYACAYAETRCIRRECQAHAQNFLKGEYPLDLGVYKRNGFEEAHLFRVANNTLYWDWPWGRHRVRYFRNLNDTGKHPLPVTREVEPNHLLFHNVLRLVQLNDSVFFIGSEQSMLPWLMAFPAFSYGTHYTHSEMPFPWPEMFSSELTAYAKAAARNDFSDKSFDASSNQRDWDQRIPKAAFYASFNIQRRLVWDQAVKRPDLIEAPLHINLEEWRAIDPWNFKSFEKGATRSAQIHEVAGNHSRSTHRPPEPGYVAYLANITTQGGGKTYTPGHYKYVVVVGIENAPTGRIAHLLAHSGAVILLHRSAWT